MSARHGLRALALLVGLGLPGSGCAPETAPTDRVRISIGQDESTLTPYTYVTGTGWTLMHLVYDALLELDAGNEPRPLLAREHHVSADGLVHTFPLHENVHWHDGTPFTADDVVFTFGFAATRSHSRWTPAVRDVTSVEARGPHEVVITLRRPVPTFAIRPLSDLPILPRHLWEDHPDPEGASVREAVGTGPYRLVSHMPDQRYLLERNVEHFRGIPEPRELEIVVIPERATAFAALRTGEIHLAQQSLEPQLVRAFEGRSEIAIRRGPGFRSEILLLNTGRPPLTERGVRRAIGYAIDVEELVAVLLLGHGAPGTEGYARPESPPAVEPIPHAFDLARARELLEEAGHGEGIDLTLLADAADPLRVRAAELLREQLGRVGIRVRVQTLEAMSVTERVWPGFDVSVGRDYELALFGWSSPIMLDPTRIGALVHSDPVRGSLNLSGLRSDGLDALVEAYDRTTDPADRARRLQALQVGISRERPFVPLFYPDIIHAYRPEAYDRWIFQDGLGVLQKLSFLPDP